MSKAVSIGGRTIGPGHPVYIIAEMSANHGQDFAKAKEIIHAMKEAGADAVKLQTYTPDTMTIDCNRPEFKIDKGTIWEGKNLYELYSEAYTPWEWQPRLKEEANRLGMDLFSTPFDASAVDFLMKMDVPVFKIASFELTDIPLIQKIAKQGCPIIMSTGMGQLEEIREAVATVFGTGNTDLILLKCTNAYPADPAEMNLRTIPDLSAKMNVPVGLSDHTLGISVPVAAVTLGACVIEKHFTLSRSDGGPDSAFSLEPPEFKAMVDAVRTTEHALGVAKYDVTEKEKASRIFRRSVFVVEDMKKGDEFTTTNIRIIRPAHGLPPKEFSRVLGKRAARNIERGTPLSHRLLA